MIEISLTIFNAATLLLFGIILSLSFCGIKLNKTNVLIACNIVIFCGIMQAFLFFWLGELVVWKLYPLITHLPIILTTIFVFKNSVFVSCVSVFTTYLLCQPARLVAITVNLFTDNPFVLQVAYTPTLFVTAVISLKFLSARLTELFKSTKILTEICNRSPINNFFFFSF